MPMFKIIAHRGASADAPDNTAEAFRLALAQKADLIETDVHITGDGVLVLEHDDAVAGKPVAELALDDLRALRPGLMTVAATLAQFGARASFCWEIKAAGVEVALVTLVRDLTPAGIWPQTEFTSGHFASAVLCRRLAPGNMVGWLTHDWDEAAIARVRDAGLPQICPPAPKVIANPGLVNTARAAGLVVRVWHVDAPEDVRPLAAAGVYGGTVNWPQKARAALASP